MPRACFSKDYYSVALAPDVMNKPTPFVCTIIAGPNGAGKTTFALSYLPEFAHCRNFVNADLIAAGGSGNF